MFRRILIIGIFASTLATGCGEDENSEMSVQEPQASSDNVVGLWTGTLSCTDGLDLLEVEYIWFLCPNGTMKGLTFFDFPDVFVAFLDQGNYTVLGSDKVEVNFESIILEPSESAGISDWYVTDLLYDSGADTLTVDDRCPVELERVDSDIVNSDCQ